MTLGELIKILESAPQSRRLALGFDHPHSYRGYYEQLAFEPARDITVERMLTCARAALHQTFCGWKGGDYRMDEHTDVWLACEGSTGETIGPNFLQLMLASESKES